MKHLLLATLVMLAACAHAELPPTYYMERQAQAPDYYAIEVVSVQTDSLDAEHMQVDVVARVDTIYRCSSARAVGDMIHIRYVHEHYKRPVMGPSPIPLLQEGQQCPAWLEPDPRELCFIPAARGFSFREMRM